MGRPRKEVTEDNFASVIHATESKSNLQETITATDEATVSKKKLHNERMDRVRQQLNLKDEVTPRTVPYVVLVRGLNYRFRGRTFNQGVAVEVTQEEVAYLQTSGVDYVSENVVDDTGAMVIVNRAIPKFDFGWIDIK